MVRFELSELDDLYRRFQRSLRPARGMAGVSIQMAALFPIFLPFWPIELSIFAVPFGFFMCLLWVDAYMSLARGSSFAMRLGATVFGTFLILRTGAAVWAFDQLTGFPGLQAVVLLGACINALILGTVADGLFRVGFLVGEDVRHLFASDAGGTGLFRRPTDFIREVCRMNGVVVIDNLAVPWRVALLALAASGLEGGAYYYYLKLGYIPAQKYKQISTLADTAGDAGTTLFTLLLTIIGFGFFYSCLIVARRLRHQAQRKSVLSASEVQSHDPRAPILFLRVFRDDQISLSAAAIPLHERFYDPGVPAGTLETLLVRTLTDIGPVVALGKPDDQVAPPGAARSYHSDGEWQSVVERKIACSRFVVLVLDNSPGLHFELHQIELQKALFKTMIVVPPAMHGRLKAIRLPSMLRIPVPEKTLAVLFDSRGSPQFFCAERLDEMTYELVLRVVRYRLETGKSIGPSDFKIDRRAPLRVAGPILRFRNNLRIRLRPTSTVPAVACLRALVPPA